VLAACAPKHHGGNTDGGVDQGASLSLRIDPVAVTDTLSVTGTPQVVVPFRAYAKDATGTETEVTSQVSWTIDPSGIGVITAGGVVTAAGGGSTMIHAGYQGATANASLSVQVTGNAYGPGTDSTSPGKFSGGTPDPTAANAPVLEYPEDQTVLPANLPAVDLQWTQVSDSNLYRVHFTAPPVLDVYVYNSTNDIAVPAAIWTIITNSVRDVPTTWTVEGVGPTNLVRTSTPRTFTSTADTIDQSAIYVWQPSTGTFHIIDLATAKDIPLPTTEPLLAPGQTCSGCHRISRDGKRFGYTYNSTFWLGSLQFDATSMEFVPKFSPTSSLVGTYVSFDPNEATQLPAMITTVPDVVAQNTAGSVRLEVLSADTGATVASNISTMEGQLPTATGQATTMPDWSYDGSFVVFSAYDPSVNFVRDLGDDTVLCSIFQAPVHFDGATYQFGAPTALVTTADTDPDTGQNNILPSISPDGSAVAFTRANGWWSLKTQASLLNLSGQIMIVRRSDGHVFELDNGSNNSASLTSNTWPQWAPTIGSKYAWIAYGSERPYGHLLTPANHSCGGLVQGQSSCKQLWVMAVDKAKLASGTIDPSSAPFWIPGQSINEQYVSPQWTTSVISIQ
jgi:hypothetical protein